VLVVEQQILRETASLSSPGKHTCTTPVTFVLGHHHSAYNIPTQYSSWRASATLVPESRDSLAFGQRSPAGHPPFCPPRSPACLRLSSSLSPQNSCHSLRPCPSTHARPCKPGLCGLFLQSRCRAILLPTILHPYAMGADGIQGPRRQQGRRVPRKLMVRHITNCMESIRLLATRTISSRQTY
jgi:hypothetical protein